MPSRPRRYIITTLFTSPWKNYKKNWTTDTRTSSSTACGLTSKPIRRRKLPKHEATIFQFLILTVVLQLEYFYSCQQFSPPGTNHHSQLTASSQLCRAMSAALRGDRNRHCALWTVFGYRRRRCFSFLGPAIHLMHH